jgi:hypothetical protein
MPSRIPKVSFGMQTCPHGGYEAEAVAELETGEVSGESPPFAKAAKDGDNAVVR